MCVYCRLNEKKDSKYIIRKDGKYAMTEDGKKVPKICPECGAEMTLQIKGEPIYICKNDHYFGTMKFPLKEGFEFNSVNKNKKKLNAADIIFLYNLNAITEKIINYDKNTILSYDEKEFMLSLAPGTYLTNDEDIKPLVRNYIKIFGYDCDLNWIDTSNVTDMSYLFDEMRSFTGNVSEWDVSNVTDMGNMFGSTNFNGDLSKWDVSNVTNMDSMFEFSLFNGDISNWDVSNVTDMSYMFMESQFNGDISKWNVSNVEEMTYMFYKSQFNGDISNWDVSNVINMKRMFMGSEFNNDITKWDVSNVADMAFMFDKTPFNNDISNWNINSKCKTNNMFKSCPIKNEYKPKMLRMNEAFDFNSIKDTRSIDALKTIEKLQHEQDFIDVPKIKGPELAKLKGFVAGMQKTDQEIHYTYTQDKDNVNGRILKIFTNNHVLHMFVKKYLVFKNFLDAKGIELKIVPVCDQGKLNIWYTGQTNQAIAPNEYQFDLDTNASVLKGWKINNIILDGFVVSFWDTYDNEGGRSGQQLYQLAHNSQHVYLYNCSYSPNKNEMNKHVANVLHHKLKHLKHSTLHLKAAIDSINNGKDVDILALKWLGEAFDFNNLKNTSKTGIQRAVDTYLETAFKTDIIVAKTNAIKKAIEGYIKSIRRYDNEDNLHFEYTEDDNILKIKILNRNQEIYFNTSPLIRLSSKMFNLGKSLPKIEFVLWKCGAKILNIHLNTGLSMEDIATKGHSLTYYIENGLYILDLKHIALNNLILDRFILNDEDISYLYNLNVKHIYTPKTRYTGVTKMINYKEFMNFPHISFTNNQGKTPKGLFMDEIEQVSN